MVLLSDAINILKKRIEDFLAYETDGDKIKGVVQLIRPSGSYKYDFCGLNKFMEQYPKVFVMNGDHLSILSDKQTIDTLNENVTVI